MQVHSSRDKVALSGYDDVESDDSLDAGAYDEHVLDVDGTSDEDDISDDGLTMEDYMKRMPQLRKQLSGREEEEKVSEEEEEDVAAWGSGKNIYYDDDMEMDEDAAAEEEEEALRTQKEKVKTMKDSDFLDDFTEAFEDKEGGKFAMDKSADQKILADLDKQLGEVEFSGESEIIHKNLMALTKQQRLERINAEAPELLDLLSEFKDKAQEVTGRILPLLERCRNQELPTSQGISLLEVKNQMLLNYCLNLAFYFYLKADGKSVKNHPVIEKLVELRLYLEKIKPLEQKLQYQIDKLVKTAITGAVQESDPLRHGPNLSAFGVEENEAEEGNQKTITDGIYRAPRIAPAHYVDTADLDKKKRNGSGTTDEVTRKSAASSRIMKELAAEVMDAPEEVMDAGNFLTHNVRTDQDWEDRLRAEEEMMIRLPVSRSDKTMMKRQAALNNEMQNLADFDDLATFSTEIDQAGAGNDLSAKKKLMRSLVNPSAPSDKNGKRKSGGDNDIPQREKKFVNSSRGEDYNTHMNENDDNSDVPMEDDPFYLATRDQKQQKRSDKDAAMAMRNDVSFMEETQISGKRAASYDLLKNKGLTPTRKKEQRNPRVKQRNKYERAKKKLGSVKATMRTQDKPYGGEETGIKKNLARSVKF